MAIDPIVRRLLQGTSVSEAHNPEFLDKIDETIAAVNGAASAGVLLAQQVFTGDGTYTPTPGAKKILVQVTGGGGAGGGCASDVNPTAGTGGSGAGTAITLITLVDEATTGAIVIGAGGIGDGGGFNVGEHSTFIYNGQTVQGDRGSGGRIEDPAAGGFFIGDSLTGGGGSTGGGGYVVDGGRGGQCYYFDATVCQSGKGGDSMIGTGAAEKNKVAAGFSNGLAAAANSGAGGSGGVQNNSNAAIGGDGGSGLVVIYEYA